MSKTAEIWKRRVAGWRASGATAEAFSSRGRGWLAGTLRWWASQLRRKAPPPVVRLAQLVRAALASRSDEERAGAIVVEALDARVRITIERGPSARQPRQTR